MRRHTHCDSRYFLPPLYCRVGITAEEGTSDVQCLIIPSAEDNQSARAAAALPIATAALAGGS